MNGGSGPVSEPDRWAELVTGVLAGNASSAAVTEYERLLVDDAGFRLYVAHVRPWWRAAPEREGRTPIDSRDAWQQLRRELATREFAAGDAGRSSIGHGVMGRHTRGASRRIARPDWRPFAVAAGLGIAVGLGWVLRSPTGRVFGAARDAFATRAGERKSVTLADGTVILLAPDSRLTVVEELGVREVTLTGEGYFNVRHDPRRRFVVHAGNAVAEDVGTQFVVRAYPGEVGVQVAVADGVVSLRDTGSHRHEPAVLPSGTLGVVDGTGVTSVTAGVDATQYFAWTKGRLVFHLVALGDVARDLGRWYGLDIRIADSALARLPFTGSYGAESPDDVLSRVAAAVGAQYERQGRTATILAR